MSGGDIFDLYRRLLAIIVATYVTVRAASFIWRWQLATSSARQWEATARRYLVVQLLRVRLHRFVLDLLQVAVLALVLCYLIWLHWQR